MLNYTDKGKGKTIVFLHGFTESLTIWDGFAEELSKKYRVICIDLPGHGKSPCLGEIHLMDQMAVAVDEVITHLNAQAFLMVGHSMGGYIALSYAEKFPTKTKALCLFHSQAAADSTEAKANRARTIEVVKSNHIDFINNFIPDLFAPAKREPLKAEIYKMMAAARTYLTKESIIAALEGMRQREDKYKFLSETPIPVLFIAGKQDVRISLDKVAEQMLLPKHAEALILDIGHMGYLEAPQKCLNTIDCFASKTL